MDPERLRDSFARIATHGGDAVALYFYSDLILRHQEMPELSDMFPVSMAQQRKHLIDALARIVAEADRADTLGTFLAHLGRAHRPHKVRPEHYPAVGTSLLATFEHFDAGWTPEVAADWAEAYNLIAKLMLEAAAEDERRAPPWWDAAVIGVQDRAPDVAVLHVAVNPDGPRLVWQPGQSVRVETPKRPRLWRWLSPANPRGIVLGDSILQPAPDGVMELHVRVSGGGQVSPALAACSAGDPLRLWGPGGAMTLDTTSGRDIVMAAWSTGWAPCKAILLQLAAMASPPSVHLFAGARTAAGLYDLAALEAAAAAWPWLAITAVTAAAAPGWTGETGPLHEVIARHGDWSGRDTYLAGPDGIVGETAAYLLSAGMPQRQVHVEDFGWEERA